MKRITINEGELRKIIRQHLKEEMGMDSKETQESKPKCMTTNSIPLTELVGEAGDYDLYSPGVTKRKRGVNSMVDTLGILNNLRLFKDVNDGGAHLSYEMMNHLNKFKNKNYYDETSGECHKAMDKVIELYKENEHGTELVKDIERVLALQTKDDEYTPSPRAKEYLKRCLMLVKEK
jgi:hypothetical protein